MNILDIGAPGAIERAVEAIQAEAIVVQLPTVFVLLAAPTARGAAQLDRAKTRLPGKNYGSAIGSLGAFWALADPEQLPPAFSAAADFEPMTGSFIRVRVQGRDFQSTTVRDGSHQGLLLDGVHRQLFRRIEASFAGPPPDPIWGGGDYRAPLCTSCNLSGDPEGSIVSLPRALAFAESRGVGLVLTGPASAGALGSYPIFGFEPQRVVVHREGPGLDAFKRRIPAALRAW